MLLSPEASEVQIAHRASDFARHLYTSSPKFGSSDLRHASVDEHFSTGHEAAIVAG